jgi:hypothetical protein
MPFPSNPTNLQVATVNNIIYVYDSSKAAWNKLSTVASTITANSLVLNAGTVSTSTATGALVVTGGVGVSGNVYANVFYTADGIRWAGNGAVFASGGGSGSGTTYTASTAPPVSGNVSGDMWYNTGTDILYEYLNDGTSSYWVDVQSLGQTGNIVQIDNSTLSGNITVGVDSRYSIGAGNGYLKTVYANTIVANSFVGNGSQLTNLNAATTGKAIAMDSFWRITWQHLT